MKVYDCSGERRDGGTGSSAHKSVANDVFIQRLRNSLDNRFHLICNLYLSETADTMPLILIGPTGIWVVQTSEAKGVFRINEEVWEELPSKKGGFQEVKPNPMMTVIEKTNQFFNHLSRLGISVPSIESVVFFSDPGAHIDSTRPAARIVPIDALQRFIVTIWRSPVVYDQEDVQRIVSELVGERDEMERKPIEEASDIFSMREPPAPKKPPEPSRLATIARDEPPFIKKIARHFPFSRQQWILLGVLLVVNIVILVWVVVVLVSIN